MSTIDMKADTPCVYPSTRGPHVTLGVGNTEKILASFRNLAPDTNVRGLLKRLEFMVVSSTIDTLVTIQIVDGTGQSVGGTWLPVSEVSELDVNATATAYTGGDVALTVYSYATVAHGNQSPSAGTANLIAGDLGLVLRHGGQFAIVASTRAAGAVVDIAWTINWLEKD